MPKSKTTKRTLTDEEHKIACQKQLERLGYKEKSVSTEPTEEIYGFDEGPIVPVNAQTTKQYSRFYCWLRNIFFIPCKDYACQWTSPYGFIPEAGCPKHD